MALLFTLLTFPALAESEPFAEGGNGDAGLPVEHEAEVRGPFKDEDLPDFHLIYRKTPTPEPAPTPEPEAAGRYDSGVKRMYEALFQRIASICGSDAKIQEGAEANRLN